MREGTASPSQLFRNVRPMHRDIYSRVNPATWILTFLICLQRVLAPSQIERFQTRAVAFLFSCARYASYVISNERAVSKVLQEHMKRCPVTLFTELTMPSP
ncbi:hypothetical protein BASA60_005155 [Batrachochytrium salamandrivorans]|nr:hypothetical protein BASA60_005155 [Batrachochytrium salamandrivorans]